MSFGSGEDLGEKLLSSGLSPFVKLQALQLRLAFQMGALGECSSGHWRLTDSLRYNSLFLESGLR
jgi:hypothetical protein